jgi:hypothetical protein
MVDGESLLKDISSLKTRAETILATAEGTQDWKIALGAIREVREVMGFTLKLAEMAAQSRAAKEKSEEDSSRGIRFCFRGYDSPQEAEGKISKCSLPSRPCGKDVLYRVGEETDAEDILGGVVKEAAPVNVDIVAPQEEKKQDMGQDKEDKGTGQVGT